MNIAQASFRDVYDAIKTERDFSEASMRPLYKGRIGSQRITPLGDNDSLQVDAVLQIEDCYEDLERVNSDEDTSDGNDIDFDTGFEQLVVFDS